MKPAGTPAESKARRFEKSGSDFPVLYHGSTRPMLGNPITGRTKETVKTVLGEMPVTGSVFDGFFLGKTPEYARMYAGLDKSKVSPFKLSADAKVLSIPNIISEEVLSSRGLGRSKMSSLKQPTEPFPFQDEFDKFVRERINEARISNRKQPFTDREFSERMKSQLDPSSENYDLEGFASKYLDGFIRSKGYDAVEMGREIVVLNPSKVEKLNAAHR